MEHAVLLPFFLEHREKLSKIFRDEKATARFLETVDRLNEQIEPLPQKCHE